MKDSKTLLKQLADRYKKHQVSVLVGAGFSRNAYGKFPLWWGLMYDLMVEMYGSKIKEDYATYCHTQSPSSMMTYQQFEDKELERIAVEKIQWRFWNQASSTRLKMEDMGRMALNHSYRHADERRSKGILE